MPALLIGGMELERRGIKGLAKNDSGCIMGNVGYFGTKNQDISACAALSIQVPQLYGIAMQNHWKVV